MLSCVIFVIHRLTYFDHNLRIPCNTFNLYQMRQGRTKWPIRPELFSGFLIMKRLGVFLLTPDCMDASPSLGYLSALNSAASNYTLVEIWRATMNVKHLAYETNTGFERDRTADLQSTSLTITAYPASK